MTERNVRSGLPAVQLPECDRDGTVLVVDDEDMVLDSIELTLKRRWRVLRASNAFVAIDLLARESVDVVIADHRMPEMTGTALLARIAREHPDVTRILLTGYADLTSMLDAVNDGHVYFYLTKPWDPHELRARVERAAAARRIALEQRVQLERLRVDQQALLREASQLRAELRGRTRLEDFVGTSRTLTAALHLAAKVADSDVTVLLQGESGTGKEWLARAIHSASSRAERPFVAVNCGAFPEALLESELFGYRRGAFTGALADRRGLIEEAHAGTLFLDEVGDTSPALQVRLLRVLQERVIRPLGSSEERGIDVRVISATHRDLRADVKSGRFRADLFYRLAVFPLSLPPLRERREDIPALVTHLLDRVQRRLKRTVRGLTPEAFDLLLDYPFPGNIRELENELERAVVLADPDGFIRPTVLSRHLRAPAAQAEVPAQPAESSSDRETQGARSRPVRSLAEARAEFERELIRETLASAGGNLSKTARALDLSRGGLKKRMRALRLDGDGP